LYLDLAFVLALGELDRLIVDTRQLRTVLVTLACFVALWWTWVGFPVLYNRDGGDNVSQRALYLGASAPVGVAAVAVVPASHGRAAFAVSLVVTRSVALGYARDDDPTSPVGEQFWCRTRERSHCRRSCSQSRSGFRLELDFCVLERIGARPTLSPHPSPARSLAGASGAWWSRRQDIAGVPQRGPRLALRRRWAEFFDAVALGGGRWLRGADGSCALSCVRQVVDGSEARQPPVGVTSTGG
jgi:hypothetical protein